MKLKRKCDEGGPSWLWILFGLIFAILAFTPVAKAGVKWLFNLPSPVERSFEGLTSLSNQIAIQPEGTMKSMQLEIGKDSFIVAFTKNSDQVKIQSGLYKLYFERPSNSPSCAKGKACMCYCDEGGTDIEMSWLSSAQKGIGGVLPNTAIIGSDKMLCKAEKLKCTDMEGFDFPARVDKESFGADVSGLMFSYHLEGGLIFGPGESTVYVEKNKGDIVGICYVRPCVTA